MRPYYERAGIAIFHGDCREILADLPSASADLLLTDPPYGMAYAITTSATVRGDGRWQGVRLFRSTLQDLDRILRAPAHAYVFCHWESYPEFFDAVAPYWRPKNALIWSKRSNGPGDCKGDYGHDYEMVLFMHKGRRELNGGRDFAVREVPGVPARRRVHPTQKPAQLLEYLIRKSTDEGELVIDPFMGSGTTLLAAAAAGRRAVGIEVEERYCDAAARALEHAAADGAAV